MSKRRRHVVSLTDIISQMPAAAVTVQIGKRDAKRARRKGQTHASLVDSTIGASTTTVEMATLSAEDIAAVQDVCVDHYYKACIDTQCAYLFGEPLQVKRGGKVIEITAGDRMRLHSIYLVFLRDVLEMVLQLGIVVIVFREDPDCPNSIIPFVPNIDSIEVRVITYEGRQVYMVLRALVDEEGSGIEMAHDPDAIVLDNFGHRPNADGTLTSIAIGLARPMKFMQRVRDDVESANGKRANPTLVVQRRSNATNEGPQDDGIYHLAADADMEVARQEDRVRIIMEKEENFVSQHQNFLNEMKNILESFDDRGSRIYKVPGQHETATGIAVPEIRSDLIPLEQMHQEIISTALGVPRNLVMTSSAHVASDVIGITKTFKMHIRLWKTRITDILTPIYVYTEAQNTIGPILMERVRRADLVTARSRRKVKTPFTLPQKMLRLGFSPNSPVFAQRTIVDFQEDDPLAKLPKLNYEAAINALRNLNDELSVEVGIPVTSFISPPELWDMYLHETLDWFTYRTYIANFYSIDTDAISSSEADPLTSEDKRAIVMGTAGKTDPADEKTTVSKAKPTLKKDKRDAAGEKKPPPKKIE